MTLKLVCSTTWAMASWRASAGKRQGAGAETRPFFQHENSDLCLQPSMAPQGPPSPASSAHAPLICLAGFHSAQPGPCAPEGLSRTPVTTALPSPDTSPHGDPARLSPELVSSSKPRSTSHHQPRYTHTESHVCTHIHTLTRAPLRGTHTQAHICTVTSITRSHLRICVPCELLSSRSVGATCRGRRLR